MIDCMRKPFIFQIEGHEVSLAQDVCAIMMEMSAVWAITQSLFIGHDNKNGETLQLQQKQQHILLSKQSAVQQDLLPYNRQHNATIIRVSKQ